MYEHFKKVIFIQFIYMYSLFLSVVASEHSTSTLIPEYLKHILEPVYPYIMILCYCLWENSRRSDWKYYDNSIVQTCFKYEVIYHVSFHTEKIIISINKINWVWVGMLFCIISVPQRTSVWQNTCKRSENLAALWCILKVDLHILLTVTK
jgi:hypothetical protein